MQLGFRIWFAIDWSWSLHYLHEWVSHSNALEDCTQEHRAQHENDEVRPSGTTKTHQSVQCHYRTPWFQISWHNAMLFQAVLLLSCPEKDSNNFDLPFSFKYELLTSKWNNRDCDIVMLVIPVLTKDICFFRGCEFKDVVFLLHPLSSAYNFIPWAEWEDAVPNTSEAHR